MKILTKNNITSQDFRNLYYEISIWLSELYYKEGQSIYYNKVASELLDIDENWDGYTLEYWFFWSGPKTRLKKYKKLLQFKIKYEI